MPGGLTAPTACPNAGGYIGVRAIGNNDRGRPIVNAELRILPRDLHREQFVQRATVRTDANGRFSWRARATASRLIQVAWRSHVNDTRYTSNGYVVLRARAPATLKAPERIRLGPTLRLRGKVRDLRPPGRVPIVAQGRTGRGRFQTFRLGHTTASGAFKLRYRFRNPASRGRVFSLRIEVLPRARWPYEIGGSRTVRVKVT